VLCDRACADIASDPMHCGLCGRSCGPRGSCVDGLCRCSAGDVVCGGTCVDIQRNHANCGACGHACGTSETCSAGVCRAVACAPGQTYCGDRCV